MRMYRKFSKKIVEFQTNLFYLLQNPSEAKRTLFENIFYLAIVLEILKLNGTKLNYSLIIFEYTITFLLERNKIIRETLIKLQPI